MNHLLLLPVLIPLIAGGTLLLTGRWGRGTDRIISIVSTIALLSVVLLLMEHAATGEIMVYHSGNWPTPYGIVLVLDRLSALMLCLAAILALASLFYSINGDDRIGPRFHLLFQMQLLGINGAFLTGDLFNLFVFFTQHTKGLVQLGHVLEFDLKQEITAGIAGKVQLATQQAPAVDHLAFLQVGHPLIDGAGKRERFGFVMKVDVAVVHVHRVAPPTQMFPISMAEIVYPSVKTKRRPGPGRRLLLLWFGEWASGFAALNLSLIIVTAVGNPGDRNHLFTLASVEDTDAAGRARPEGNSIHRHPDRLTLGGCQHDLVFNLDREGRHKFAAAHRLVHGGDAHTATAPNRVIVAGAQLTLTALGNGEDQVFGR